MVYFIDPAAGHCGGADARGGSHECATRPSPSQSQGPVPPPVADVVYCAKLAHFVSGISFNMSLKLLITLLLWFMFLK